MNDKNQAPIDKTSNLKTLYEVKLMQNPKIRGQNSTISIRLLERIREIWRNMEESEDFEREKVQGELDLWDLSEDVYKKTL